MNMILSIYKKALLKLKEKPFKLWGISLLAILLSTIVYAMCGPVVLIGLVISVLINTAMIIIFLKGYMGEEFSIDDLFLCFKDGNTAKRVLGGMGWMYLWIFIWGLIPVAGIVFAAIRTYEYRLTPYILINEPEISIKDAIKVSKERTNGYKGKMFGADILWIVAIILVIIILACLSAIRFIGWIFLLVNLVLIIFTCLFASLYAGIVQSAFYVEIEKKRVGSPLYEEPAQVKNAEEEKAYCPECGAQVKGADVFCSACGAKLSKEQAEEQIQEAISVQEEIPVQEEATAQEEQAPVQD